MVKFIVYKWSYIIIPVLFLIYSAPGALDYLFFFPDEKYYTDSVIQMMEKDDCFTPYQADGSPRFKKPIVTYWVLMASYKMFGVSRISSRLFFWVAGALLVLVAWFMAKSLSGDKKAASLAAFITAANPLVLMSANRTIPDILLVLFLTISAWGFLEIMLSDTTKRKFYWMAYGGAALAFETKGFPAAAFAGISMLFLLLNPWKKVTLKKLLQPLPIIVSVLIAVSWFVVMYIIHGSGYWDMFFEDQVGIRVSSKILQVFENLGLAVLFLVAFFIPWIFILFSKPKELKLFFKKNSNPEKSVFYFIFLWIVMVVLMSGAVSKFYDRYLLPVVPLISVFLSIVFTRINTSYKNTWFRVFLIVNLVVVALATVYAGFIARDWVSVLGITFSLLLIVAYFSKLFHRSSKEILIANSVAFLYFNACILLYPLLIPNNGKQLSGNIISKISDKNEEVFVYGNIRTAASIRVHSNNTLQVVSMENDFRLPDNGKHVLVINEKDLGRLDLSDYETELGSQEWSRVPAEKFPGFMKPALLELKEKGEKYYIATPKS